MTGFTLNAPMSGAVVELREIPDPVFAQGIVGAGAAIDPFPGGLTVIAPCAGVVKKAMTHAVLITSDLGIDVLVHMGIDTTLLHGEGYTTLAATGARVEVNQPLAIWNTSIAQERGKSLCSPIIGLKVSPELVTILAEGKVEAGKPFLRIDF